MSQKKHQRAFFGHYLSDFVYGANDGIITTFAVIAGATGATLSVEVVIILGIANLVADGFSMGASNYLSMTSEQDYMENRGGSRMAFGHIRPLKHGTATFTAFVLAGILPLLPFIFFTVEPSWQFPISAVATAVALFAVGSARSFVNKKSFLKAGFEMLFVGGVAAFIAYGLGWAIDMVVF